MKKLLFAFLLLIGSANVTSAQQMEQNNLPKITFQVQIKKPINGGNPVPKSPVTPPDVYLDDHTLYIDSIGSDSTIQLTDDTETVVYSVYVPDGTTTVVLPSTLTGDFELSVIPDDGIYYFCGDITL